MWEGGARGTRRERCGREGGIEREGHEEGEVWEGGRR